MKSKIAAVFAATVAGMIALPSFAGNAATANAEKTYRLKDGGTLYIFKDGKMARENHLGRSVFIQQGQTLEAVDGRKIVANSNEVARLDQLLNQGHLN